MSLNWFNNEKKLKTKNKALSLNSIAINEKEFHNFIEEIKKEHDNFDNSNLAVTINNCEDDNKFSDS